MAVAWLSAKEPQKIATKALKELIVLGRKQYLLQKYLHLYQEGKCSLDKIAETVGITITEAMQEAVKLGIRSEQTIAEYRKGLEWLK